MIEAIVCLPDGSEERCYARDFVEAARKIISFYKSAPAAVFQEIPMTAMRQGRENLGCFARKQAKRGAR